jgi:DNA-binding NtrC family response regulator
MVSAGNRILLIDDEPVVRFGLRDFLESHGFEVGEAGDCRTAEEIFRTHRPDAVVLDYLLPDGDALQLLSNLKAADAAVPILILTAHGSIDLAVRAVKEGAEQFLTKPVDLPSLLILLRREIENRRSRQNRLATRRKAECSDCIDPFVGHSDSIRRLEEQANKVVGSESTVLIQGETGSGKGVLARWLHHHGGRTDEPFVDLNCAGLSRELLESELFGYEKGAFTGATIAKPGLLEIGDRGTVFLDEVGDLDIRIQPKLLTVLDEGRFRRLGDVRDRRVDIRLIAATNHELSELVGEKKFRRDLYFRICTIPLRVPPLRERREDIPLLARLILDNVARDMGRAGVTLSDQAESALVDYAWPGNVRELRNVLERAALLSSRAVLLPLDLRFESTQCKIGGEHDANLTLSELERQHIERVLAEEDGHVDRAAARLGLARSSLYHKIKRYNLPLSNS